MKPFDRQAAFILTPAVPENPNDLIVASDMRRAYIIWKDGSRRRLSPDQTVAVVAELKRRLSTTSSAPSTDQAVPAATPSID